MNGLGKGRRVTRIEIPTSRREQMIDITHDVATAVEAAGVTEGWILVFSEHTTAAITINENADPDVQVDMLEGLARIAPRAAGWRHSEGNSDAHIKTSLVGLSVTVPVSRGRLVLGTWQGIYLCEFDGPRRRHVTVSVQGR